MRPLPFPLYSWLAMWGMVATLALSGETVAALGVALFAPYTLAALEELR